MSAAQPAAARSRGAPDDALMEAMHVLRWTTSDLSASLGVSRRTVLRWLRGEYPTPPPVLTWVMTLATLLESVPGPVKGSLLAGEEGVDE